jgi:hypothetical protein
MMNIKEYIGKTPIETISFSIDKKTYMVVVYIGCNWLIFI